jgi:DNA-binding FrmR family transcriptional regulator
LTAPAGQAIIHTRTPYGYRKENKIVTECIDAKSMHLRIQKIIGQLTAIDKMAEEEVPCEEILIQIMAAKSALHRAGQTVLEGHLAHCVREGIETGNADKTIADFNKAVEYFARMS